MTDYRGLLTDREREILTGTAEVSLNYVYQVRSRVRQKIDRLATDYTILADHHPDLAKELREAIAAEE